MKFGSVKNAEEIDFTLPPDHPDTLRVLGENNFKGDAEVRIGCAKWNRQDLKGFYPRGTKDELGYYSQQFNSIELNATFYQRYTPEQVQAWVEKTPDDFKFFPKVASYISHIKRLNDIEEPVDNFLEMISHFGDKLGMVFLQLHDNFGPKNMDRLISFFNNWPKDVPIALELRNKIWYAEPNVTDEICHLLEENKVAHIITDTAGRRDLVHMRLTTPVAFVRYVGANAPSDYDRLDDWFDRMKEWKEQGLEKIYFFVHQNIEKESPFLSEKIIRRFNEELQYGLPVPELQS